MLNLPPNDPLVEAAFQPQKETAQLHSTLQAPAPPPAGLSSEEIDRHWMHQALKVSFLGAGQTQPNPPVGCILVDRHGQFLSQGYTQPYGQAHAEKHAFDQLPPADRKQRLQGATAYVTLEPCSHHGKQPPCAELLIHSLISRVVIARKDPNPKVAGQGCAALTQAGKQVILGPLAHTVSRWLLPFLAEQTLGRPVFFLKWAQSLDGQLCDDQGQSQWITGPAARTYTHWLRKRCSGVLVGYQTLVQDSPQLNARDCWQPNSAQPIPLILDLKGNLLTNPLPRERLFPGRKWIYLTQASDALLESPRGKTGRPRREALPDNCLLLDLNSTLPLQSLPQTLQSPAVSQWIGKPLQSLLVEGGAQTLSLFLQAGLGDGTHAFIAPFVLGGSRHRLQLHQALKSVSRSHLTHCQGLGDDTLIESIRPELKPLFES